MGSNDLAGLKAALRKDAARTRKEACAKCVDGGSDIVEAFRWSQLPICCPPEGVVAGYFPIRSEIDPLPLMAFLQGQGMDPALPVIPKEAGPLVFRAWDMNAALEPHGYGTRVPCAEGACTVDPAVILVPLLAFDRGGARLGYGGGYYDRTLAHLRDRGSVMAVGLAFAAQEVDQVPVEPLDAKLDWVLTESEAIECAL